ncbi:MAG TPA: M13 family metallopeptidase N-terminal domain-containing protein, partial [Flavobacteriales bacterium]|nr:M13 family metallopeptidase N-terminal domain-containing protein [Flavobacteriales bacterium]
MKKAIFSASLVAGIFTTFVAAASSGNGPAIQHAISAAVKATGDNNTQFTFLPNPKTVDFQDMDASVDPATDFFDFANGNWIKNTAIPASEASWGKFNILSDNNNKVLRNILESTAKQKNEKGSVNQIIGDFYFTLMDSVKRDKEGIKPIQGELNAIDALKDKKDIAK